MKADIRHCSICMLNSMLMEMELFHASDDLQKKEFHDFMQILTGQEGVTPVELQDPYIRRLHELAGYDFYQEQREKDDREMMKLTDQVEEIILTSADPFRTALRFAIFGNLIDPAGQSDKTPADVLQEAARSELAIDHSEQFLKRLRSARSILYIADNAGEVAIDKVFVDFLKKNCLPKECQVFFGVRGTQVHNDARVSDARLVGLDRLARIVDSGSTYAGAIIESSSQEYQDAFFQADLIISKGMGNYEVLEERRDKPICFLLVAKCIPISSHLGVPRGMPVCKINLPEETD